MYVRPPNPNRARVKLPENYGGSAFNQSGFYNDMPPPARQSPHPSDTPTASPEYPRVSDGVYRRPYGHNEEIPEPQELPHDRIDESPVRDDSVDHSDSDRPASSIFSSLIPQSNFSKNFPFGHGVGGEELLILGIMLLVYLSGLEDGKTDNEFLLLLGLLLFAG